MGNAGPSGVSVLMVMSRLQRGLVMSVYLRLHCHWDTDAANKVFHVVTSTAYVADTDVAAHVVRCVQRWRKKRLKLHQNLLPPLPLLLHQNLQLHQSLLMPVEAN